MLVLCSVFPLLLFGSTSRAQLPFESADFDVVDALLNNGVNVSAIPALNGLVTLGSPSACSVAVSRLYSDSPAIPLSNGTIVFFFADHLRL